MVSTTPRKVLSLGSSERIFRGVVDRVVDPQTIVDGCWQNIGMHNVHAHILPTPVYDDTMK